MKRSRFARSTALLLALSLALVACGGGDSSDPSSSSGGPSSGDGEIKAGRGVDVAAKTIKVGGLLDLSGAARIVGIPADGTIKAAIETLNESGSLGEWTIDYESFDTANNPSESVRLYDQIREDVLAILPSFGAAGTVPLLDRFAADDMLTFVYTGSSAVQSSHTIWGATPYKYESVRAVDYILEEDGDARLGFVYQDDDAGADGLEGFKAATEALDAEVVAEVSFDPAADDFNAVVSTLSESGATHVVVASAPGQTAQILATAASRDFSPQWFGTWSTFIEAAYYGNLPDAAWADTFHWVHGFPYWGEDRPGMTELMEAYEASPVAADFPAPQNWSVLAGVQVAQLGEVLRVAIERGDLTPAGVMAAAAEVKGFDADGLLLEPVDLLDAEGVTAARVLKPDVANKTWTVVGELKGSDI